MRCPFWAIVPILGVALSASAQIYQWKDKDGKTYFSDMPPPDQPGIQMQMPKRPQPPASEAELASDDPEAEADSAEPAATAPFSQEKSKAEQRDTEYHKRRAAAEAKEKVEKDAVRTAQDCQRARAQYAALNSGQRISLPAETGGRKFLNDEERAVEIERSKELIEAFCGKD